MSDSRTSPLAIIGMSARLPGADSLEEIWEILAEGRDVTSEVGADRWSAEALFDREAGVPGRTYTTRGGFLTAVDEFDAAFFGVDPEEARKMDPQQRLSLQEAWHTIEHAGYAPEQLAGKRVGVFVGARTGDYHDPILDDPAELEPETLMGHDTSILSARISHFLDLRGPNLTVNTACSSMGVALHLAGQSLRAGEIDLALVGGVHVMCTAQRFLMHSRSRLLSKRGECRPFDEAADGFVLGEGVGFVLLKSRSAAMADGDHIHGNILATAVNHGGHSEKGIAAPKREAQVAVIHDAITRAKIAPETISYVEAHGTGTYKGDAIEARSLREAYGKLADSNARILMGSAKANFGHALTAAVLPGLLRIVLGFRHRKLAGQAHFDTANELVDMEEGPFRISRNNADWAARSNQPRRAALSAFSYSGTNFHMILEEEPERMPSPAERGPCLVLLSGKTPSALRSRISQLETWMLRHRNEVSLADVAFNLGRGRAHFSYRAAFVASDVPDCLRNLRAWLDRSEDKATAEVAVDEAANTSVQEIGARLGEHAVGSVSRTTELNTLAELYGQNTVADWGALFAPEGRRIDLPGYPFERTRFWLRRHHLNDATHMPSRRPGGMQAVTSTLVFCRRDDVYQRYLLASEREQGDATAPIIQVKCGDRGFRQLGPTIYQIDPQSPADYKRLFATLEAEGVGRMRVVHLWNYECEPVDFVFHGNIDRCLHLVSCSLATGLESLTLLEQAWSSRSEAETLDVLYLHHGVQPQNGWVTDVAASDGRIRRRSYRLPARKSAPDGLVNLILSIQNNDTHDVDSHLMKPALPLLRGRQPTLKSNQVCLLDVGRADSGLAWVDAWRRAEAGTLVVLIDSDRLEAARLAVGSRGVCLSTNLVNGRDLQRVEAALLSANITTINGVVKLMEGTVGGDPCRGINEVLLLDELTKHAPLEFFLVLEQPSPTAALETDSTGALFAELRHTMQHAGHRRGTTYFAHGPKSFAELFTVDGKVAPSLSNTAVPTSRGDVVTVEVFKRIVAEVLRVAPSDLDLTAKLDSLDFNSMRVVDVCDRILRTFGTELRPAVFYKHKSLQGVFEEWSRRVDPPVRPASAPATPPRSTVGPEPIAVVGMSGRFPMARDLEEFWENLCQGRDCISEMPPPDRVSDTSVTGGARWGGYISDIDKFDPAFFGISAREAELMDPQQRIFLECVWRAIEDAGYDPSGLAGTSTGVFVGVSTCDYAALLDGAGQGQQAHAPIGLFHSMMANRVSYLLDLRGPSQPIDTACSSSLVAVHRALEAIRHGQCTQAIVGGVNALFTPPLFAAFEQAGMLAADGRCKTFDERANGYVRGEGVGALLLKPLRQAEADGDDIHGVIRASAENHGGHASSLTAPSSSAQAEVVARAYREAGVDPRSVGYIEAHGTGTALGDPIEIDGLRQAFAELSSTSESDVSEQTCGIGSVKTHIGHLEAAAGIAGLIKGLLALRAHTLPGNLHFQKLNPYVALADSPFYIVDHTQAWTARTDVCGDPCPRRMGVSSFGFGGVNAHVVLEEYVDATPQVMADPEGREFPIIISAKNADRLREKAAQLRHFTEEKLRENSAGKSTLALRDLAYTLQVGRTSMEARVGMVVRSCEELVAVLGAFLAEQDNPRVIRCSSIQTHIASDALTEDSVGETVIRAWIEQKNWIRLVEHWVKGNPVEWSALYPENRPRRLHLPTYPFARERYWVEPADTASRLIVGKVTERRMGCLHKRWEPAPSSTESHEDGRVLILTDAATTDWGQRIQRALPGSECHEIESVSGLAEISDHDWSGCIDLLACGRETGDALVGLEGLQWLIEHAGDSMPLMLGVTRGLETIDDTMPQRPMGSTRAGLYRLLQSEYPAVRSRHLDVDASDDDVAVIEQIVAEFRTHCDDVEIGYRTGRRYRAVLREVSLEENTAAIDAFPSDHVLWVSGGTRGLGLLCAQHWVEQHGVRKVVLTGRTEIPPREDWSEHLAKPGAVAEKIKAVQGLEKQGATVRVLSMDHTAAAEVQRALQTVRSELGSVGGVLHCAGSLDQRNPAFIRKSRVDVRQTLAPKVQGTDVVLDVFKDEPLAFMVFFSSVSALIPALGSGVSDYAMANAHLDYAAATARQNYPVLSVQWPSWKETGMGEVRNEAYDRTGLLSLTNEEGLRVLERVLAIKHGPVVMPVLYDPACWSPERLMQHRPRMEKTRAANVERPPADAGNAPRGLAMTWLAELFAQELKTSPDRVPVDRPFPDFGMDSILLAQVRKRVENKLGVVVDPSAVFEHPTLETLAVWLEHTHYAALKREVGDAGKETLPSASNAISLRKEPVDRTADIAVVGLTGRFPGADNLESYWRLLVEGRSAIGRVPDSRWSNPDDLVAGLLSNITEFDPEAFLLSEEDARAMDPQALVVLEESWRLFHQAGYAIEEVKGTATGVYLGARMQHRPTAERLRDTGNPILAVGQNYLAANISRYFDLHGPSLVVDTACSSALVAMNLALQALRGGEIEAAVVGGVSLLADDRAHRLFQQRGLLSPDAAFHMFDHRSAGVVLGEAAGLVLLKTVAQAEADGDRIHAVIRGLAINNDGRTAGPAAPNLSAQKEVMQTALTRSGLQASDIDFLEANGSGSEVTDLLELKAIEAVYGTNREGRIQVGSVKPNIGHPLCAEGMVGFIKLVLMLERGQQVPFLSGHQAMTHFDIAASAFEFLREARPWTDRVRRAVLNCFADGGTNAHVVLENWQGAPSRRETLAEPVLRRRNLWAEPCQAWSMTMDHGNPFLRHHTAHGQALLPGLAYLDFLYHKIDDGYSNGHAWELQNLTIHHPLTVPKGQSVHLEVQREALESGGERVRLSGRVSLGEGKPAGSAVLYVSAEIRRHAAVKFSETIDVADLRASSRPTPLEEEYAHFEEKGLKHTGLMRAEGKVYPTKTGRVIELSLPDAAQPGTEGHDFHPTLIDGAAIGAGSMFDELLNGEDRLFLPLHFGQFRAVAPIRERCFARVLTASLRRKNEILYSDLEFFDTSGSKIAELTDFAYKLVRQATSLSSEVGITSTRTVPSEPLSSAENGTVEDGVAAGLIRRVIAAKLKQAAATLDLRLGYYELGLESAMLLDVVASLERLLDGVLSPTLLFEFATPTELAEHLEATYANELARLSSDHEFENPSTIEYIVESFPVDEASPLANGEQAEAVVADLLAERLALWCEEGILKVRTVAGCLTASLRAAIAEQSSAIAAVVGPRRLLPLTRSQRRYWVLSSLQPERSAYNNPIGMRLQGAVDLDKLQEALRVLINSHHVLRSGCPRLGRGPVLAIAPPVTAVNCEVIWLDDVDPAERDQALQNLAKRESRKPINPSVGPNLRITLVSTASDEVTLLLTAHHTVFDGYSYLPVMREIMRIYRALSRQENASGAAIVQYENYVLREPLGGDERSAIFWREHLAGASPQVALPLDHPRATVNAGHGDTRSILLDRAAYRDMTALIQERRVTLFAFMLSLLKVAVSTWAKQNDLVFGTTVQCRDEEEDADVIGDFTNFIPIRSQLDPEEPFAALLQRVYQTSLRCLQHKSYPFDEIVRRADTASRNSNPVYNILVNQLPSISEMETQLSDDAVRVNVSNNRLLNQSAMLDLRFEWYEEAEGLRLICEYNTDLFDAATIERVLQRIESVLLTPAYTADAILIRDLLPSLREEAPPQAGPSLRSRVKTSAQPSGQSDSARAATEEWLIQQVLDVKEITDIARLKDVNFFELGLGSFDVANLAVALEEHFPAFEVTDVFKHPTIRLLADHLVAAGPVVPNEVPAEASRVDSPINFDLFRT